MSVRVAVFDPLPVFRRGVMAILGTTGVEIDEPTDLVAWTRRRARRIVLLTLRGPGDWALLTEVSNAGGDVMVIAVLDEANTGACVRALRAGATGVVARDAATEALRETFEAVVGGKSMLPVEVLRALADQSGTPSADEDVRRPAGHEIEWLRELARGVSVAQLSTQVGYSERMMFRLLRGLYDRIGVRTRAEALLHARSEGWL